jgi:transcriptional regulator with XRE-family HTH domain
MLMLNERPTFRTLQGCQVRMARAALHWTVHQLAHASGVSDSSIRRIESSFGPAESVSLDLLLRLQSYFESRGFHFIFEDERGPGVLWKRAERRRVPDRRGGSGSARTLPHERRRIVWAT